MIERRFPPTWLYILPAVLGMTALGVGDVPASDEDVAAIVERFD